MYTKLKKAEGGSVAEEDEDMNANNFRMMRKSFLEEYARAETPEKKQALQKNFTMQTEGFDDDTKLKVFKEEQKQRNKKAEGGSLMVPPEMEMEEEEKIPEDTYDNIPEDEMAAAEASQKPDGMMQEDYMNYVLTESLDAEEQQYLTQVLEGDEQLSAILDKVLMTASEFSGAGPVEGPGTGVSDSIPARLSDGEFVMTKKATDQIGADQLQTMMDEAEKAYDGGLMKRKAMGGLLSNPNNLQDEEIKKDMMSANRMPSLRAY
jgi:hypothetical protein